MDNRLRIIRKPLGTEYIYMAQVWMLKSRFFRPDIYEWTSFIYNEYGYCIMFKEFIDCSNAWILSDVEYAQNFVKKYAKDNFESNVIWEEEFNETHTS